MCVCVCVRVCVYADLHPNIKEEIIKLAENPDAADVDALVVPIDKVRLCTTAKKSAEAQKWIKTQTFIQK